MSMGVGEAFVGWLVSRGLDRASELVRRQGGEQALRACVDRAAEAVARRVVDRSGSPGSGEELERLTAAFALVFDEADLRAAVEVDRHVERPLVERLATAIRARFALLDELPAEPDGRCQAQALGIDPDQIADDFLVALLVALQAHPELAWLNAAVAQGVQGRQLAQNRQLLENILVHVLGVGADTTELTERVDELINQVWMLQRQEQAGLFGPPVESARSDEPLSRQELADYRDCARRWFSAELAELVPLGGQVDQRPPEIVDLRAEVSSESPVLLLGQSGAGKTFHARHAAVEFCEADRLVIWARCGDYEEGLSALLAGSMASFSAHGAMDLIATADATDTGIVLVLDALNDCPPALRTRLLEELNAFRLRYPVGILITSTIPGGIPERLAPVVVRLQQPDADQREAILHVHGARHPERISAAFTTPLELSLAAQCEAELDESATSADLYDTYIRQLAPAETVRDALRAVAAHLHSALRGTASLQETRALLGGRQGLGLAPDVVDEVLDNPLVVTRQHRVRFQHELLAQFLAAEQLVLEAATGSELGQRLSEPINTALGLPALALETDPARCAAALRELAEADLYAAAIRDELGERAGEQARTEVSSLLVEAASVTAADAVEFSPGDVFQARWISNRRWTEAERAMLTAAGVTVHDGYFLEEIQRLVDRSDELCLKQARALGESGKPRPISAVVAATYTQSAKRDEHALAVSLVSVACELESMRRRFEPQRGGVAASFVVDPPDHRWGRFYFAALTFAPLSDEDHAVLPGLLRGGWAAGGYHLRLKALRAAEFAARAVGPSIRAEVIEVLESLEPTDLGTSTYLVETLAAYEQITPSTTVDEIQAEVQEMLARPEDLEARKTARRLVGRQFDNEAVLGPYGEAIDGLARPARLRLLVMAVRADGVLVGRPWVLQQLAEAVPTGDPDLDGKLRAAFRAYIGPPEQTPRLDEGIASHVAAIHGWGTLCGQLPLPEGEPTADERAWRLVDTLILHLDDVDVGEEIEAIWEQLHTKAAAAVDALSWLYEAAFWEGDSLDRDSSDSTHERLATSFPGQLRRLLEWALTHDDELTSHFSVNRADARINYILRTLGRVGNEATAQLLHCHIEDSEIGTEAVEAIRQIREREASDGSGTEG